MEKAADIDKMISVTMFYENHFWNWRPDGIVIEKFHQTLYILEFKRSSDRNKDFLRIKDLKSKIDLSAQTLNQGY